MPRRRLLAGTAVALLGLCAGCGGTGDQTITGSVGLGPGTVPGGADRADVAVIEGWVNSLRRGDIGKAASYFALPSVAENGAIVNIRTGAQAKLFNASLPCGARLIRAVTNGKFTTGTFRLTDRPGPGAGCGPGVGGRAQTSFVIREGKIEQWRRVGLTGAGGAAPSQSA
jgi:hypothetical protein